MTRLPKISPASPSPAIATSALPPRGSRRRFLASGLAACGAAPLLGGPTTLWADDTDEGPRIHADFPGGNIRLRDRSGDTFRLAPDLRDTQGFWFYWYFAVTGAAGRTLKFEFENNRTIGNRGPAVSTDAGRTWSWLADKFPAANDFEYRFADDADEVRFAMAIPYVPADLQRFLKTLPAGSPIEQHVLCTSRRGRDVPYLRVGRLDGDARYQVLITGRHHACETMASFVIEGLMQAALADDPTGEWFRENVELLIVPLVDFDGCQDGDQGKNRKPRDHNRDYSDESVHPEVAAIRKLVADGRFTKPWAFIDCHCPYIRGGQYNETIYQVGSYDEDGWQAQANFGRLLETHRLGALPYKQSHDLPHGKAWNTRTNYSAGMTSRAFMGQQAGVRLATTFEFPFATASGTEVHIEPCQHFGQGIAVALRRYFLEYVD